MPTAASASGVSTFPEANRHRDPSHLRYPHDPGQLRNPQASGGEEVVQRTPSLSRSLYPDQRLLAEPSRTLVRRDHAQTHPPPDLSLRARPRPSDPGVHPRKQQEPATVPMGGERQHDCSEGKKVWLCAGIRITLRLMGVFEEGIFQYARQDEPERMDKDSGMAGVPGLSQRDQRGG